LSDADLYFASISRISFSLTCSPTVSSLSFHSIVSNNVPPVSSWIATFQGTKVFNSVVDTLPNKFSECCFCMTEVDNAAISEVAAKNTLSALSPDEIQINGYQVFSNLNSPLCHRGV